MTSKETRDITMRQLAYLEKLHNIGGYIVNKPEKGQIGTVFSGWDDSGEVYQFAHDYGVIFKTIEHADELRADLGDGWVVTDIATITGEQYLKMRLLSTIFDDFGDKDPHWEIFYPVPREGV